MIIWTLYIKDRKRRDLVGHYTAERDLEDARQRMLDLGLATEKTLEVIEVNAPDRDPRSRGESPFEERKYGAYGK